MVSGTRTLLLALAVHAGMHHSRVAAAVGGNSPLWTGNPAVQWKAVTGGTNSGLTIGGAFGENGFAFEADVTLHDQGQVNRDRIIFETSNGPKRDNIILGVNNKKRLYLEVVHVDTTGGFRLVDWTPFPFNEKVRVAVVVKHAGYTTLKADEKPNAVAVFFRNGVRAAHKKVYAPRHVARTKAVLLENGQLKGSCANIRIWREAIMKQPAKAQGGLKQLGKVLGLMDFTLVPIHMGVMPDGRVFTFGSPFAKDAWRGGDVTVWNPKTNAMQKTANLFSSNSFCGSLAYSVREDKMMVVGGHGCGAAEHKTTFISINDGTGAMTTAEVNEVKYSRWYASLVIMPDGKPVILGGRNLAMPKSGNLDYSATPEIFEDGLWKPLDGAYSWEAFGEPDGAWWYPRAYLGQDGRIFGTSGRRLWSMTTEGTKTVWKVMSKLVKGKETFRPANNFRGPPVTGRGKMWVMDAQLPYLAGPSCSSVMYRPGEVAIFGGGATANYDFWVGDNGANSKVSILEYKWGGRVTARAGTPMKNARTWSSASVLPNGQVAVTGGTSWYNSIHKGDWVAQIEIWTPPAKGTTGGGSWKTAASITVGRVYHSGAVLLPDARVLIGGGGLPGKAERNGQVFIPPYLYAADGSLALRPVVAPLSQGAQQKATYGGTFKVNIKNGMQHKIKRVTMISTPAVTHSHNNDQRFIDLKFTTSANMVFVTIPWNKALNPPGYYMVYFLNAAGVPSEALRMAGSGKLLKLGEKGPARGPAPPVPVNLGEHLGCFDAAKVTFGGDKYTCYQMTRESCQDFCAKAAVNAPYKFMGLLKGRECICSNTRPTAGKLANAKCNLQCGGEKRNPNAKCGSWERYTGYAVRK